MSGGQDFNSAAIAEALESAQAHVATAKARHGVIRGLNLPISAKDFDTTPAELADVILRALIVAEFHDWSLGDALVDRIQEASACVG